jgi:hypothetical protein
LEAKLSILQQENLVNPEDKLRLISTITQRTQLIHILQIWLN